MAPSHPISAGHAISLGAYDGGRVLSFGGVVVLVPHRAAVAERDEISSLVSGVISFSGHTALRRSFGIPGLL
jgi:hypothetical protein